MRPRADAMLPLSIEDDRSFISATRLLVSAARCGIVFTELSLAGHAVQHISLASVLTGAGTGVIYRRHGIG
jgi:hypothetical protein